MDILQIEGGVPLRGRVAIDGAKNAALPACVASLLTEEPVVLRRVPQLRDVSMILFTLGALGKRAVRDASGVILSGGGTLSHEANAYAVQQMRASFLVLGPLVARIGRAVVPLPGGCRLGTRPIDLHLEALRALGARIDERGGSVHAEADRLRGARIDLPLPSVGATEQVLMAASLAKGETVLTNAAVEPEVLDLVELLRRMGAEIERTDRVIRIAGHDRLRGAEHRLIPDRHEAGTYLLAAAATGGEIVVSGVDAAALGAFLDALRATGVRLRVDADTIEIAPGETASPIEVTTAPHPGFPTDLHPQFAAYLARVPGRSRIEETIFESRFAYVRALCDMGAQMACDGRAVTIDGVDELCGRSVQAPDIRAGAALVLAGLSARGTTRIDQLVHIDRGYSDLVGKLRGLGANIERRTED
jgi:UDP-N-acetylglucosamine 1-carboxyvinyltransferase